MTRRILTVVLAACAALPVMAQGGMGGPGGGRGNRVDFLAGYLSLTADQKTAAKAIFDAAEASAQTVAGQMKSAHDALRQAIKDGKTDVELDTLSMPIGTLSGQITAIQAKAQAKFYALLTAEQKAKYDEMRGGMGMGGFGGGPGMGMAPRGAQGHAPRNQ
ncbi:MAG TPA: periplasmic heavy metal sensor [Paludibaculum sp.]